MFVTKASYTRASLIPKKNIIHYNFSYVKCRLTLPPLCHPCVTIKKEQLHRLSPEKKKSQSEKDRTFLPVKSDKREETKEREYRWDE